MPAYKIEDDVNMLGLFAQSPAPKKGINPGETLMVSFKTSMADGSDIYDYVSMFRGQSDYVIGFHGISADIINGQSLTGVLRPEVPEPAITAILAVGAAILLRRRNKQVGCGKA
ncbi:MAG: PEP-CTERM sorting domain-containing protein [Planctomycetes bacterium]|nr:PEP-CTERM sorting domain-containing protein [Planctomycetota bacterium]